MQCPQTYMTREKHFTGLCSKEAASGRAALDPVWHPSWPSWGRPTCLTGFWTKSDASWERPHLEKNRGVLKLEESNPTAQAHSSRIPDSASFTGLTHSPSKKKHSQGNSQGALVLVSQLYSGLLLSSYAYLAPSCWVLLSFIYHTLPSVVFPILHTILLLLSLVFLVASTQTK